MELTSFKLMYSSGRFPTELTGHGRPSRVDCQKSQSANRTNKNYGRIKLKSSGTEHRTTKTKIKYNHEWGDICLIDIHPFNVVKAPFLRCWCIMCMFINKTETTIRMICFRDWLGMFHTSTPNNKRGISVCRMTVSMTTCQDKK